MTKSKIKLPNFMLKSELNLVNIELIIDTKEEFLLQGKHFDVDIIKSGDIGPCLYYMNNYNRTIYKEFNVTKHSLYYIDFNGTLSDLDFSIYKFTNSLIPVNIQERENIIFSMERTEFYYCLKSKPDIKIFYNYYYFNNDFEENFIELKILENIEVDMYSSNVSSKYRLIFSNDPSVLTFHSSFKYVDLAEIGHNTMIIIDGTTRQEWGYLSLNGTIYVKSPQLIVRNLVYPYSGECSIISSSLNCHINVTDRLEISEKIITVDSNIFLEIQELLSTKSTSYPFVHQISEDKVTHVLINQNHYLSKFNFNENTTIIMIPAFSSTEITNDMISKLRDPIDIVITNNLTQNFQNKFTFINSSIPGFSNDNSIINITHDSNKITFLVERSVVADLCVKSPGEKCPDGSVEIDDLNDSFINDNYGSSPIINIIIMPPSITINITFKTEINFINIKETKCSAKIVKLEKATKFSFTNFNISTSVDFNKQKPSRYINCTLKSTCPQKWGNVEADVFSLRNMENIVDVEFLTIDRNTKINSYAQFNNNVVINGNIFALTSLCNITLDQRSLTNEMKLVLYGVVFVIFNLQSDLNLKLSGNIRGKSVINTQGKGVLTCNVIEQTHNFSTFSKINRNLIDPIIKNFCIGDSQSCKAGSEVVNAADIGNKIQNELIADFIEVQITNDEVIQFNSKQLMIKDVKITSADLTQKKINILTYDTSNMSVITTENILINLSNAETEYCFYKLALKKSKIFAQPGKEWNISYVDSLSFDLNYIIETNFSLIKDNNENIIKLGKEIGSERFNAVLTLNSLEYEVNINEDTEVHINAADLNGYTFNDKNNLKLFEIVYNPQYINKTHCLVFKSDSNKFLDVQLNALAEEFCLYIDFQLNNSSITTDNKFKVISSLPQTIYLNGNITILGQDDIYLDHKLVMYTKNYKRFFVIIQTISFGTNGMIDMRNGNIDLECHGSLGEYTDVYREFPVISTLDEKGVSYFCMDTFSDDFYNSLTLRIGFMSQPSDQNYMIGRFDLLLYVCYGPIMNKTVKLIYDQKFHGFYEGDLIFKPDELGGDNYFRCFINFVRRIKESPMKICAGSESECPSDSIAINSDFSVADRLPKELEHLNIIVASDDKKIGMNVDCKTLNITIAPLSHEKVRRVTLNNILLNIKSLCLQNLEITSDKAWNCSFSEFSVHNCSIESTEFTFMTPFSASLDYDIFKTINYNNMIDKLVIDRCNANNITFMANGWQIDTLPKIMAVDLIISFQGMNIEELLLKIQSSNIVCQGLNIIGDIKQVRCYGSDEWRLASINGEIIWDHGANDVIIISDTFINPIRLTGSGKVTEKLGPIPEETKLCFYEDSTQKNYCTTTNQYPMTNFLSTISNLVDFNIKVELASAMTNKELSTPASFFRGRIIEISSINQPVSLSVNLTEDLNINQLRLIKTNIKLTENLKAQITIGNADFARSKLIFDSKLITLKFNSLIIDSNMVPSTLFVSDSFTINFVDSFVESSIKYSEIVKGQTEFIGFENELSINANNDSTMIINDKITIIGRSDFTFNDNTQENKTVTFSQTLGPYYSSNIALNLLGECNLTFKDSWRSNANISIKMKGTITGAKKLSAIEALDSIHFVSSSNMIINSLTTHTNTSFNSSESIKVFIEELNISGDSFVELLSDLISLETTSFSTDRSSYDVFPVTFSVTQNAVSSFKTPSITFSFKRIQIKSIITSAASSASRVKLFIDAAFTKQVNDVQLMFLSDHNFYGYNNETCIFELMTSESSIKLLYLSFGNKIITFCFADTCDGGHAVTTANYQLFIPPGHRNFEIRIFDKIELSFPLVNYERVSIIGPDNKNADLTFSPFTIKNLELKNINIDSIDIPTSQYLAILTLYNCKVSKISGSNDNYKLFSDLQSLKQIVNNSINFITIVNLTDGKVIEFNESNLVIDTYIHKIDSKFELTIEYSQKIGNLTLKQANHLSLIKYKVVLNISSNANIVLEGEWHHVSTTTCFINFGLNSLNMISTTSYSDPFIYVGNGIVTKKYLERGKTVVCACNGECRGCPEGVSAFNTFESAASEIKKMSDDSLNLFLYVSNSDESTKLELNLSKSVIPVLTIYSLEENTEQYVTIIPNEEIRFDKLSLHHINAISSGNISTADLSMNASFLTADSVKTTVASLDTTKIGIKTISVAESISILRGFTSIEFSNDGKITRFDNSFTVNNIPTTKFILQFDSENDTLSFFSSARSLDQLHVSAIVKAATKVIFDVNINYDITFESAIKIEAKKGINGTIIFMKYAEIMTRYGGPFNKMVFNEDAYFGSLDNSMISFTINELEIIGSASVQLSNQLMTVSILKLTFDANRSDFPFIHTLSSTCSRVSIKNICENRANVISLYANTLDDINNLLLVNNTQLINYIDIKPTIDYSIAWVNTDDHIHGMWNGNSIFSTKKEQNIVYLNPLFDNIRDLPAEICISDSGCTSSKAVQIPLNQQINFSLFPDNPRSLKITLETDNSYTMNQDVLISLSDGDLFEIIGKNKDSTGLTILSSFSVFRYSKVNIQNIKITSTTSFTIAQSSITFSEVSFDGALKLNLERSDIYINFDLFASEKFVYTGNEAESISINNIPAEVSIKSANSIYPFITTPIKSRSFTWNGPSSSSSIDFIYDPNYEQSPGEIRFLLNGDASIRISQFTGNESYFKTNMVFDVQSHNVFLSGIDFIPVSLFTSINNVELTSIYSSSIDRTQNDSEKVQTPMIHTKSSTQEINFETQTKETQMIHTKSSTNQIKPVTPTKEDQTPTKSATPVIQTPAPTPSPTPTPIFVHVEGTIKPDGSVVVPEFKPPQHENVILQGDGQKEGGNLIIENLTIEPGTNVHAENLVIEKGLRISGGSSLKPLDEGKIDLKEDNKVEIILSSMGSSLPQIDLGEVGADYNLTPKELEINLDLTGVTPEEIDQVYGSGKTLISGRTLNCDEWIAKTNSEKIVGVEGFNFDLVCEDSRSRFLDGTPSMLRSLVLKASPTLKPTDGPKNSTATIIIVVVVVVVVIAVICVVVFIVKRRNRRSSRSTDSSSNNLMESSSSKNSKRSKFQHEINEL